MTKLSALLAIAFLCATSGTSQANPEARPDGLTIGIGAGWVFPADLMQPNTVGVRFRLPSGLTFEPRVELSRNEQTQTLGMTSNSIATTELTVSTTARIPLNSRGPVDVIALGGLILDYTKVNPEGLDNNSTDTTISVVWGLSVEYWIHSRWAVSFTAYNPLFSRSSSVDEQIGGMDTKSTATFFGAIFDPTVVLMVHLFF